MDRGGADRHRTPAARPETDCGEIRMRTPGAATQERFRRDERAYWEQREMLLARYPGRWVAIVDGQVVAVGDRSGEVIRAAYERTGSRAGYAAHVGREDEVYRIRRVTRGYYDASYHHAVPKVAAEA